METHLMEILMAVLTTVMVITAVLIHREARGIEKMVVNIGKEKGVYDE